MEKYIKYIEYAYLVIAVILFYEGFQKLNIQQDKAYFSLGLGVMAVFMYFFKRHIRKKQEKK